MGPVYIMKKILLSLCLASAAAGVYALPPEQHAETGKIVRHLIDSPQLGEQMTVDVWLPEGYDTASADRYPVLYMHDGQNLYDASTTWNGQSWEMDRTAGRLIKEGEMESLIIVGIHSDPERRVSQLMPENAVSEVDLSKKLIKEVGMDDVPVMGNEYAEFVVSTLKPFIDATYVTLPDRDNTGVMGSSMGGLMSLYLISEYPEVFGKAGCLSTHWYGMMNDGGAFGNAMMNYVTEKLPDPETHKIYFDHGTTTIDAYYGPWEEKALSIAREKGYEPGKNLSNYVDEGAPHNEDAWSARVDRPLRFLFPAHR